jgi:hypothetical protein
MTMYDDDRVVTLLREVDLPLSPPDRLGQVTRRARGLESRRATALAGVMAVVLVAGVVSAINLGHRGSTEVLTVADAADATTAARTARVTMVISLSGAAAAAVPGGNYTLSGPVDFAHQRYSLKGRLAGTDFELRAIGKDRWTTQLGIPGKKWLHMTDETQAAGSLDQLDPSQLLHVLKRRGRELSRKVVDGRTVFVLKVPAEVLNPTANPGTPDDVLTVAVDSEDRVRTLTTARDASGGDSSVSVKISYDDFGIDADVRPPPRVQVAELSDVTKQFGGSSSSGQISTSSSQSMSPEACAAFAKQRDEIVARSAPEKRAEVARIFDQMLTGCAKKP